MLVWSIVLGLWAGAFVAAILWVVGDVSGLDSSRRVVPASDFMATAARFVAVVLAAVVLSLLVFSVLQSAIYRSVLEPRARAFAYLRLGRVEGAMIVLQLLYFVFLAAFELGCAGVIFSVVAAPLLLWAKIAIGVAFGMGCLAAYLAVGVRLMLAGPLLVATGRIDLGAAWRLGRGRFWTLLAMAALALVLSTAISTLAQAILNIAMVPFVGPLMGAGPHPRFDPSTLRLLAPWAGPVALIIGFALVAQLVVWLAPFSAVCRTLMEGERADAVRPT